MTQREKTKETCNKQNEEGHPLNRCINSKGRYEGDQWCPHCYLTTIWKIRLRLYVEGNKLRAEGYKLCDEGDKLWNRSPQFRAEDNIIYAEGCKLKAEGCKLRAEGDKLHATANRIWAESVTKCYGNIILEWKNWNDEYHSYECHLENGEIYGFD